LQDLKGTEMGQQQRTMKRVHESLVFVNAGALAREVNSTHISFGKEAY